VAHGGVDFSVEPTLNIRHDISNDRINTGYLWRRRVEVESTTRSSKERIAGFEDREGHRTPFASVVMLTDSCYKGLLNTRNSALLRFRSRWCYCGANRYTRDRLV
jgi:hypothetical protein